MPPQNPQNMHRRASDSARGRQASRPQHNPQCTCSVMQLMTAYCATTAPYGFGSRRQRLPSLATKQMQQWQWQTPRPASRQGSQAYASSTHRPSVASIASSTHSRNMSIDDQGRIRKQRINSVASSHYSPRQLSLISNVVNNSEQQFQERRQSQRRKSSFATAGFLSGGLPTPPAEDEEHGLDPMHSMMPPPQRKLSNNFILNPEIIEVEEDRRPVHRKSFKFKTPARPPVLLREASNTSTGSASSEIHDPEDVKSTMSLHPSSLPAPVSPKKASTSSPMGPPPIPAIPAAYATMTPISPPPPTATTPTSSKVPNFSYRLVSPTNTPSAVDDDNDDATDEPGSYFPTIRKTVQTTHHHTRNAAPSTTTVHTLPTRSKRAATFSSSSRPIVTPHAVIRPPPKVAFAAVPNVFDFGFGESTLTTTITAGGTFLDEVETRKKKGLRERLLGGKVGLRT